MKIKFLGAAQTVTGSRFLVQTAQSRVLVDCGLFQGLKTWRLRNREPFPVDPKSIQAVILTHAHLDHSGFLPALIKQGFRGKIHATPATRDLCAILLPDSGHLQEEEAEFANRHGFSKHHPALPLYTEADARACLDCFVTHDFGQEFLVGEDLKARLEPVGHILGAASVSLNDGAKTVVFSGDVGRSNDFLMRPPKVIERADVLVLESTYGNRRHDSQNPLDELKVVVNETYQRGGVLLIPAFAVGRAQSVLYLLARLKKQGDIPDVPVYLNSPMAIRATEIFHKYRLEHKLSESECEETCNVAHYVRTAEESRALNDTVPPAIIISASGMATGGRILHHLKAFVGDPKNTVLFMGFQAAGTRGEAMIAGVDKIKIHGAYYPVRAGVKVINSLSAHADYVEMTDWLKQIPSPPKKVYLVHGEPAAQDHLRCVIQDELKWPVEIPAYLEEVELSV